MEWLADPTAWLGLLTLIVLELVLGIDNLAGDWPEPGLDHATGLVGEHLVDGHPHRATVRSVRKELLWP